MSQAIEANPSDEPQLPAGPERPAAGNAAGEAEQPGGVDASEQPGDAPAAIDLDAFPRWLRQLAQYLPICSQFVVEGNIRDVHLVRSEDGLLFQPIVNCLWELLREQGCEGVLIYDRISGFQIFPEDRQQAVEQKLGTRLGRQGQNPAAIDRDASGTALRSLGLP